MKLTDKQTAYIDFTDSNIYDIVCSLVQDIQETKPDWDIDKLTEIRNNIFKYVHAYVSSSDDRKKFAVCDADDYITQSKLVICNARHKCLGHEHCPHAQPHRWANTCDTSLYGGCGYDEECVTYKRC